MLPVSDVPILDEPDVNLARQHARRLAFLAGLSIFDQTRFATAVAVIARLACQNGGGETEFGVEYLGERRLIQATIRDRSGDDGATAGWSDADAEASDAAVEISGARKLVDRFSIDRGSDGGTVITLAKELPDDAPAVDAEVASLWAVELAREISRPDTLLNQRQREDELVQALAELHRKEADLKRQLRRVSQLNRKLDILSLVASKTDNGVIITDHEGCIEWVNDGFTKISGYDPFEVFGKKPGRVLQGPETDPAAVERIREKLRSKQSFTEEILNYRKDGQRIWVSMNVSPVLDEHGEVSRFIAIQSDVTRHRRTETELQAAKEAAENLNRAKGEFMANISHEIRTPMNAILGMTQLALDTPLAPEQREFLTTAHESARSLLRLLNDILDFSKIESGTFSIETVPFQLDDCLDSALKALAVPAHEKQLELVLRAPRRLPNSLEGDPIRLRQVLMNLIGNAIKFTERGDVLVTVEQIAETAGEVELRFNIRDSGIGIPLAQQERIFGAFTQADNSTKRRYGGTGLGLTIASQLVETMGGHIGVESVPGRGSTFFFTARFKLQAEAQPYGGDEPVPEAWRALPLLVIDDNAGNRELLIELLGDWQLQPTLVNTAAQAQRLLTDGRQFGLVLLDATLPDADSFALAGKILEWPRPLVLMMLSAVDQVEDARKCRRLGLAGYVNKPIGRADLLAALRRALTPDSSHCDSAPRPPRERASRPLRILVAEDVAANRKLASRILEKRGHTVLIATRGDEAVAVFESQPLDVILMDVQMPDMDGLEATTAIRAKEQGTGRRIPIVAMTAHAMRGDRQRCLEAGMDAYLPKPLDADRLQEVVESLSQPNRPASLTESTTFSASGDALVAGEASPARESSGVAPPLPDFSVSLVRLAGDKTLFCQLAEFCVRDAPKYLAKIQAAIDAKQPAALQHAAHSLKGLIGNFDARPAIELALSLERLGGQNEIAGAESTVAALRVEIGRLSDALRRFCGLPLAPQ